MQRPERSVSWSRQNSIGLDCQGNEENPWLAAGERQPSSREPPCRTVRFFGDCVSAPRCEEVHDLPSADAPLTWSELSQDFGFRIPLDKAGSKRLLVPDF